MSDCPLFSIFGSQMVEDTVSNSESGGDFSLAVHELSQSTAMVFGATGQDGSYLCEILLNKGYKVYAVVRRASTDNTQKIKHLLNNPSLVVVSGDVTDYGNVHEIVAKYQPQQIYNLAAMSHVKISFEQPSLTWDVTAKGALNILEAIRNVNRNIRYYQASSSEMFGSEYDIDENGEKYQDERTRMNPRSPYSVAKLAAHNFTVLYRDSYGLHANSGILFNHGSPRRGTNFVERKVTMYVGGLLRAYKKMLENGYRGYQPEKIYEVLAKTHPKLVLGNLESYRDWCHSKDMCEMMVKMLEKETPGDYVVCSEETHTIRELLDVAFGFIMVKDWKPFVEISQEFYRPAEVDYLRGRCTKARKELGWQPKYTFKSLIEEMVKEDAKEERSW